MAHDQRIQISLRNEAGLYCYAAENGDNTYTVGTQSAVRYIDYLPIGWEGLKLTWDRSPEAWGIFRSDSNSMQFVKDGRAILLSLLFGGGGADAYCLMTIYVWNEATFGYDVFYPSEIDFSDAIDDKAAYKISVNTLDSKLYELYKANANSPTNIPLWEYDASLDEWNHLGTFGYHDGIKVLFKSYLSSGAKPSNHISYSVYGFDEGSHGAGQGFHTIPAMNRFTVTQNNGSLTYFGNDILEPVIAQGDQPEVTNEINFTNTSKPFTNKAYCLKDLVISPTMSGVVHGKFSADITYPNGLPGDAFLKFVVFEIDKTDEPPIILGEYQVHSVLYQITLPMGGSPYHPTFVEFDSAPATFSMSPDKVYVFSIIFDGDGYGISLGVIGPCAIEFEKLELSLQSEFNNGTAPPVNAPKLPGSTSQGYLPADLWGSLVQSIDSTTVNGFGFPDIIGAYTGVSTFLASTPAPEDNYGLIPSQLLFCSENSVRNIQGQQYITTSISDFFATCFNMMGCGLGIEGDTLRIERLEYFFDAGTEIIDLGVNISKFTIEPFTDGRFNNITAGYSEPETNNDFGVDEYNIPAKYRLPLKKKPKVKDLSINTVTAGQNEIEKMRQQIEDAAQSSPSSPSNMVILQLDTTTVSGETQQPDGTIESVLAYNVLKYPTAQSTDPTAATAPYIKGLYYPDTAINVNLMPAKNILRLGRFLRSMLDQLDSSVISYCNQYQMNYNDPSTVLTLPGISTNIYGQPVNSVADIPVSSLDAKLFRPYLLKFTATYPGSMYSIINSNPRGYIRFAYIDDNGQQVEFKGFIWSVTQEVGNNSATNFELLCHPDVSDAALGLN